MGGQGSLVWPRLAGAGGSGVVGAGGSTGIKLCSQEGLQEPLFLEGRLGENRNLELPELLLFRPSPHVNAVERGRGEPTGSSRPQSVHTAVPGPLSQVFCLPTRDWPPKGQVPPTCWAGRAQRRESQVCRRGCALCRAGSAAWEGLVPEEAVWLEGEGDAAPLGRCPWKTVCGVHGLRRGAVHEERLAVIQVRQGPAARMRGGLARACASRAPVLGDHR